MSKKISLAIFILAWVGAAAPALAQRPPVSRMGIHQIADEFVRDYGAYTREGPSGFIGVPLTAVSRTTFLLVAHGWVHHQKVDQYDPGVDLVPVTVSVIRVTGPARGRNILVGWRTDERLADGQTRVYRVAFGFYHPAGHPAEWVTGWYPVRPVPTRGVASHARRALVLTVARQALALRRHNRGDLWRQEGDDFVIARYGSEDPDVAWERAFPDYMVHQLVPMQFWADDPTQAARFALARLRRSGVRAGIVILGFPRLFH